MAVTWVTTPGLCLLLGSFPALCPPRLGCPTCQALSGGLVPLLLGLWTQHSHTLPRIFSLRVWGWIFKKERKKEGRKTFFSLKSGSFDFFLKVYYTFWCPRKILLWDIHSTKHFHQGVLLLFLVKRFKNPTWTEKLHWYLWKNKIRMLFIAFPTRKSNCLGIHPS